MQYSSKYVSYVFQWPKIFLRVKRPNRGKFYFYLEQLWFLPTTYLIWKLSLIIKLKMGQKESKDRLSKQDLDFLKTSTRFDEDTIIEWYRGFKSDCPDGRLTPKGGIQ